MVWSRQGVRGWVRGAVYAGGVGEGEVPAGVGVVAAEPVAFVIAIAAVLGAAGQAFEFPGVGLELEIHVADVDDLVDLREIFPSHSDNRSHECFVINACQYINWLSILV